MRERLVVALAEAIAVACEGQRVTYANSKRYVTRDFLTKYRIRRNTEISSSEWMHALRLAQKERASRRIDGLPFAIHPDRTRILFVYEHLPEGFFG